LALRRLGAGARLSLSVYWLDMNDRSLIIAMTRGIGAHLTNLGKQRLPVAIYQHTSILDLEAAIVFHHPWTDKIGLDVLLTGKPILKRYGVDPAYRPSMRRELTALGITDSVVFPDIDGLANELKERFL
jgi:hypothetical protein